MFKYLNSDEPPVEVPLPGAPLLRAIVQVQHPTVLALLSPESARDLIAKVQARLADAYPLIQVEQEAIGILGQPQEAAMGPPTLRLRTVDETWEATFHPSFVAISTSAYHSRNDFLTRLRDVLDTAHDVLGVRAYERLGVRYVNQITADFGDVTGLLQPDVVGAMTPTNEHFVVEADVRDLLLDIAGDKLHVRYGSVPAGGAVLLGIDPCPMDSWVLDLDAYTATVSTFVSEDIVADARRLAERCYRVFRGTVNDQFLMLAGGAP
jgi:uncharacterized protein (TIGR04255 family)